jgi:o-succinylbenzoate---CoA ligase
MSAWVQWGDHRCSVNEIGRGHHSPGSNDFEQSALEFIHRFVNGQEFFTMQTSGSTGSPKTIILKRNQLIASAKLTIQALGLPAGGTALVCLDTRYIAGVMMLVRSLTWGMNIVLVQPVANPLAQVPSELVIHFAAFVPYQVNAILNESYASRLQEINHVLIGGAPLSAQAEKKIQSFSNNIYITYGMTETLSHVALRKISGNSPDYYEALPGIRFSTDDRHCLIIEASHLNDGRVLTNDMVELISPTQFRWTGRVDHVINTGGVKVSPEKIEMKLNTIFEKLKVSRRFFICGQSDSLLGEAVTLVMEGEPLDSGRESQLKHEINEILDRFEKPKSIFYVSAFKETATGKVSRTETIASIGKK